MTAAERLNRIDWNFPSAGNSPGSVHGLHWFPGNFIAQIPSALVQLLSSPGDLVLDPFAGSGTTAVEALRLGRRAICSDRLSSALMISEAKLSVVQGALDQREVNRITAMLTFESICHSNSIGSHGEGSSPVLNEWYAPRTLSQLRFLWDVVEHSERAIRPALIGVFSDVLFNCASTSGALTKSGKRRRHHWGWIADNVRPKALYEHNAIRLFTQRLSMLSKVETISSPIDVFLLQQDARALALTDKCVDLVVTSPPYVGVIDYTCANRLLYAWMGWSLVHERQDEIGARFRRTRRYALEEYLVEMRRSRDEIFRVLKPNAFCAMVVGASRRFPTAVESVVACFSETMPVAWGPLARFPSRRRVSDRLASDAIEFVCVFKRP